MRAQRYLTSLQCLLWGEQPLQPGQRLLVVGASGGCGVAALQIARARGARDIVAVCSAANADFARSHGATQAVDYNAEGFSLQALFGAFNNSNNNDDDDALSAQTSKRSALSARPRACVCVCSCVHVYSCERECE
jgi:NADPH:quinone reductase-like Zn-dependent oxidoreductase